MKNFKKVLSLALALLMVIGGLLVAPVDAEADTTYKLVEDVADINDGGSFVIIAELDGVYYAMNEIDGLIESLRNGKDIPYVGLYLATVTDDISEDYDIPKGVYITEVATDSPAMKAGLQNGDVITHINGDSILTDVTFSKKIAQLLPGTTCEISVKRQNGNEYYEVKCTVTIGVLQ